MENTVKKLEMKFKLLTVINRDYEAMLERAKKKKRIHLKSKKPLKNSGRNIRSEDQGYRKQGCSRRKPRGH